jgi:hypothetical protein
VDTILTIIAILKDREHTTVPKLGLGDAVDTIPTIIAIPKDREHMTVPKLGLEDAVDTIPTIIAIPKDSLSKVNKTGMDRSTIGIVSDTKGKMSGKGVISSTQQVMLILCAIIVTPA